jgi:L-rhamnose mutarotase
MAIQSIRPQQQPFIALFIVAGLTLLSLRFSERTAKMDIFEAIEDIIPGQQPGEDARADAPDARCARCTNVAYAWGGALMILSHVLMLLAGLLIGATVMQHAGRSKQAQAQASVSHQSEAEPTGRQLGVGGHRSSGKYVAGMIKVKPELLAQYMCLHDHTWDEVMERMNRSKMRDFTVWLHEETNTLFHQFVYVGDDYDADMAAVAADPVVRFWWSFCEPCQEPRHWDGAPPSQGGCGKPSHPSEWWSPLKLVNHCGSWSTSWASSWPDPDFEPNHPQRLTSTKDAPPPVHNRPSGWTNYTQEPYDVARDAPDGEASCPECGSLKTEFVHVAHEDGSGRIWLKNHCWVCNYRWKHLHGDEAATPDTLL